MPEHTFKRQYNYYIEIRWKVESPSMNPLEFDWGVVGDPAALLVKYFEMDIIYYNLTNLCIFARKIAQVNVAHSVLASDTPASGRNPNL